jgi:hypothetical protein
MRRFTTATLLGLCSWLNLAASAQGQVVTNATINATDNIFGSGHSGANATPAPGGGGGGTAPTGYALTVGAGRILTFSSVTGTISIDGGGHVTGPDGGTYAAAENVDSFNGISGVQHLTKAGFLVGVFVGATEPADPAPAKLVFSDAGGSGSTATTFTALAPLLNQTFFIGDGLTGTGSGTVQQFAVPATATRLFMGFADGSFFVGPPGAYVDNQGSLSASFSVVPVPEPGTFALVGLGLAAVICGRRRGAQARGVPTPALVSETQR